MTELLPCPFCGATPTVEIGQHNFDDAQVCCSGCGTFGPDFDNDPKIGAFCDDPKAEAIKHWNARFRIPDHAQQPMGPWCIPAGEGNECVICEGDDPNKPGKIVFVLRAPNGLNDRYRTSHEFLAEQAAMIVRAVNQYGAVSEGEPRGPSKPLQCLRCGTVDAFGPASRVPREMWAMLYLHDWDPPKEGQEHRWEPGKNVFPEIHNVYETLREANAVLSRMSDPKKYWVRRVWMPAHDASQLSSTNRGSAA